MSSELSVFAARLRDFIGIASTDSLYLDPADDLALRQHLDIEFNGMAIVLFGLQFLRNPAYRKFCEARRVTPNSITHWKQIPAVPTVAFKEWELTSLSPEERVAVFHSSGTTEQRPSRHFHSTESIALYEASLWPWFEQNVRLATNDLRLMILTPRSKEAPNSSLVHMFETIRSRVNAPESVFVGMIGTDGGWTLDFSAATKMIADSAASKQPVFVLGTAFSFVHLIDHLTEQNLRFELSAGSRVMETGGYKGRSRVMPKTELHALISKKLGIPNENIVCEYGMSELSSQAYEIRNPQSAIRNFQFPPWARVQVISPETGAEVNDGETGILRIFDLANVFSVMAIQTEDLAIRRGDGFELLGRAERSEPRGCSLMVK
jgi:Acyl-protein synthetase, LuxE.